VAVAAGLVIALMVTVSGDPGTGEGGIASLAPTEETAPPTTPERPDSVTIAVTGEILPHPSIVDVAARHGIAQSYDFTPLFADLRRPLRRADLAICHLEVPVAPEGSALSGYPNFAIPTEIGDGIRKSGWDRCSTASNHSNDKGPSGIAATLDALDAARVGHHGTARTLEEAEQNPVTDVAGVPVAHLSYTSGFNGTAPEEEWMANVIERDEILADARQARTDGAEIVVVSLHWGDEYDSAGSPDQRALAQALLASRHVDLIVGHGPHVIQPIEKYRGKYALLSVGNLIANQGTTRPSTYDGMIATITFRRTESGGYVPEKPVVEPTWYDHSEGRVRLVNRGLEPTDPAWVASHLDASRQRTRDVLGDYVAGR
jgi:poly-gamma-glutamate synthesis protein (capsule biosynthesis protein)